MTDKKFLLTYPNLDNPCGRVVLENEFVVLQRLVVGPGEWEGVHSHPGNQVYVHIRGGEWTGRLGSEIEYAREISPDGEVGWMDAIPLSAEHDSGNTGDTPIDIMYVTLKTDTPLFPETKRLPQSYPDVSPELLLENDRVIVQRTTIAPGEWTGIHGHPGNQVAIYIRGGRWSERHNGSQSPATGISEPGTVSWIDAVDPADGHDFGNTGDTTLDFVLVTLK